MTKDLICVECPKSCALSVDMENCRVVKVSGNQCPKGEDYGKSEIENPSRILTATVIAQGLSLRVVPVRTDKPIPKARIQEAAGEIRRMKISRPVQAGDVLARDFLGLGVSLVCARECR